jgi:hypothetical protein
LDVDIVDGKTLRQNHFCRGKTSRFSGTLPPDSVKISHGIFFSAIDLGESYWPRNIISAATLSLSVSDCRFACIMCQVGSRSRDCISACYLPIDQCGYTVLHKDKLAATMALLQAQRSYLLSQCTYARTKDTIPLEHFVGSLGFKSILAQF